jgi:hypothetical protein
MHDLHSTRYRRENPPYFSSGDWNMKPDKIINYYFMWLNERSLPARVHKKK